MGTKGIKTPKEKVKSYTTPEEALNAKHEAARKFVQKADLAKITELLSRNS